MTGERTWTRANLLNGTLEVHARGRNGNSTTDPSYRFAWIKVQITYDVLPTELMGRPFGLRGGHAMHQLLAQ